MGEPRETDEQLDAEVVAVLRDFDTITPARAEELLAELTERLDRVAADKSTQDWVNLRPDTMALFGDVLRLRVAGVSLLPEDRT